VNDQIHELRIKVQQRRQFLQEQRIKFDQYSAHHWEETVQQIQKIVSKLAHVQQTNATARQVLVSELCHVFQLQPWPSVEKSHWNKSHRKENVGKAPSIHGFSIPADLDFAGLYISISYFISILSFQKL
jgi:hypothetical protein